MSGRSTAVIGFGVRESGKALRSLLPGIGLEVCEAANEAGILAAAALEQTGVVLLDTEVGRDGIDICRRLKRDPACIAPVILVVPAQASDGRKKAALAAGADVCLPETCGWDALLAVAGAMVKVARERRDLAQSLQRAGHLEAQLRDAQDELEQFASQACHDVEEPLRAITTFAELTGERPDGRLSNDDRTYLGYAVAAGKRFRRLLRSVLSYSRAGRLRRDGQTAVDLRIAAASALQALRRMTEASSAVIHFDEPLPLVAGDLGELQQVFEQLIANAILYHQPGSAPTVRIGAARADSEQWTIWISDDGPGVPEDRRGVVFQPFKRLHGREVPGAGMGLPIAKKIIEAHGGRIWIESGPASGARVCFVLPSAHGTRGV